MTRRSPPPLTPDGRYLVVVGASGPRLWRAARPDLEPGERQRRVDELMKARRAVRECSRDPDRLIQARARVDAAKRALGERGPPWWSDGTPDLNRRLIKNSPYADWWRARASAAEAD